MFWEQLLHLCAEQKITPNTVCANLGLSTAIATKWKKGAIPRDTTLKMIADYFGTTIEYLKGETEQKEKQPTQSELSEKQKRLIKIIEGMSDDQLDRFEKILAVVETTEL